MDVKRNSKNGKRFSFIEKAIILLFAFSINFETYNIFNLNIDFIITKFTTILLVTISLSRSISIYSFIRQRHFYALGLFFGLYTLMNYINIRETDDIYISTLFFLNILIVIILSYYFYFDNRLAKNALVSFTIGAVVQAILLFLNIGVTQILANRFAIMGSNANEYGLRMVIALFIILTITSFSIRKPINYLVLFVIPLLILSIFASGSRVALFSLLGGLIILFVTLKITLDKKLFLTLLIALISIPTWFIFKETYIAERAINFLTTGDVSSRNIIWKESLEIAKNNLWFGIGKTGFQYEIKNAFSKDTSPHNVLLEIICYTGIFGLLLFMIFLSKIYYNAVIQFKKGNILFLILLVPITGMILSGQILDQKIVWLIFAYHLSLRIIKKSNNRFIDV